MKILFIGDVVGKPGRQAVAALLPKLKRQHQLDFVIANGENSAHGAGLTSSTVKELLETGVDVITAGDHVWDQKGFEQEIEGFSQVIRPLNIAPSAPGRGSVVIEVGEKARVGVINLMGRVFMPNNDCPFRAAQNEVNKLRRQTNVIVVDFHAEATSEKIALGRYLDGQVSLVVGTHTHVQTADEQILPKGTAYLSDAGMCGPHDGVLGRDVDAVIRRFVSGMPQRLEVATDKIELCGVIIEVDENTGLASSIERLRVPLHAMILRAKWVLPVSAPPIENGAVTIEGETITAVGPAVGEGRDLGEVVLAPGLINAHCHLDYTNMRGRVPFRGSFTDWILRLVELKKTTSDADYAAGIQAGIQQALDAGTTTLVNIESFPALIDGVPATPMRVMWCLELTDWRRPGEAEAIVNEAVAFGAARSGDFGLSPHAPYTAGVELYRLAARHARGRKFLFTTHLAESEDEDDMFRRGTGRLYDAMRREGRDMADCKRVGPVQLLREAEALTPECLVAHANCLTELDLALLGATGVQVVHCPGTHQFFKRGTPLVERLQHVGVNVCLGSDSLASGESLSMFAQMQEFSREFPRWSAEQILPLATTNGAKALQRGDRLGKIAVGAAADLIAVPLNGNFDPYEAVVFAEKPVTFMMINGKVVWE